MDSNVKGKWRLGVRSTLSAAHALRHYEGKCERLHGHNFEINAEIEGERLQDGAEIVLDFKILKNLLAKVLEPFDHAVLNEIAPFDRINPSSENLARFIADELGTMLKNFAVDGSGPRVRGVTVSEKDGQYAVWIPSESPQ